MNQTEKIAVCVPGTENIEPIDENTFKGKFTIKIGPVKVKFNGLIEFTQRDSSSHELTLKGSGKDQNGKGGASMTMFLKLIELDIGTEVQSNMTLSINGRIAQFGSKIIEGVTNKLLAQFINNFKKTLLKA